MTQMNDDMKEETEKTTPRTVLEIPSVQKERDIRKVASKHLDASGGNETSLSPRSPARDTHRRIASSPPAGRLRCSSLGSPYHATPIGLLPSSPLMATSSPRQYARHLAALPLLNPSKPHPPRFSQIQKAMEGAIVKEHRRIIEMEAQEETMDAERLRARLRSERHRMAKYAAELAKHKTLTAHNQLEAEMLEEGRVNGLMRRLEELQTEKGRIINELEREEEMVSQT